MINQQIIDRQNTIPHYERIMKIFNYILFAVFVGISANLIAADSGVPELDRLKGIYQQELKRLQSQRCTQHLHVPQDHIKAMRKLEMEFQQSGELRNLLAVRKERKRFIGDPRIDAIIPVSSPAELRKLQQAYIANYNVIKNKRAKEAADTKEKYIIILKKLQKKLTRQGKIESALAVMNEIEAEESGGSTTASSTGSSFAPHEFTPTPTKSNEIEIETLKELLHGEVLRWNSYNKEITIKYDFNDENQMQDWKGGEWDGLSNILNCRLTVAWLKIQMSEIKRVECDMFFHNSPRSAGLAIGNSLTAMIEEDRTIDGKIYQTSSEDAAVKIVNIENAYGQPYHNVISINDRQVSWKINGGRMRHGTLQEGILYPSFIGFGRMNSESSYNNVTITGILSKKQIERLKKQM